MLEGTRRTTPPPLLPNTRKERLPKKGLLCGAPAHNPTPSPVMFVLAAARPSESYA